MRLAIIEPFGELQTIQLANPHQQCLGELLAQYRDAVEVCTIDGEFVENWQDFRPTDERIELFLRAGFFGGALFGSMVLAKIATAVIVAVASTALSMLLQYAIQALTGKDPGQDSGRTEEVFGIAGLTNTVALGTPKLICYGERRVFGHIINTRVDISEDGKTTRFSVLYFMGYGEIESIGTVQINDTTIDSFPGCTFGTKLGTMDQTPFGEFPSSSQVFSDGRTLVIDTPLSYTTQGTEIDRARLIFQIPFLFNIEESTGERKQTKVSQRIEYRIAGNGSGYTEAPGSPDVWTGLSQGTLYRVFNLEFPSHEQWEIRLTALAVSGGTNEGGQQAILYNVMEEISGVQTYPGSALLAIFGVASAQITSFESMRASGLVKGCKVDIWNGTEFTTAWTQNRAWIVRDMITHPVRGLGHRIPASLFDDDGALVAANYWNEQVAGFNGDEDRDHCDLIINERRPGWDWIKEVLSEGNAALIPSGGQLKIVVDHAQSPNLLYSCPGNIIEGTLVPQMGGQGDPPNIIRGEFPDESNSGILNVIEVTAAECGIDIGDELLREETISLRSIVREANARRKLAYVLQRKRLVQRRWQYKSPESAMVSETFDVVSLSYKTVNGKRGFSGFVPDGSTVTNLLLDRLVTLVPSTTYALIVRHQANNAREDRIIATAAGVWGQIAPTVAFDTAPAEGDLWSLGIQNLHILPVMIEDVKQQEDGTYALTTSEHLAAVYEPPELPDAGPSAPSAAVVQPPGTGSLPLPLDAAAVTTFVEFAPDGSWLGRMSLAVTPGLPIHAGFADLSEGDIDTTIFLISEPMVDDYFVALPAMITILAGGGVGQTRMITAYDGTTQLATVSPAWDNPPGPTSQYQITFSAFDTFWGFDVHLKVADVDAYTLWATYEGTAGELTGVPPEFSGAVKMIPIGISGNRNSIGCFEIDFDSATDERIPEPVSDW